METLNFKGAQAHPCRVHVRGENRLLTMLKSAGEERVVLNMERVALKQKYVLAHRGEPITHVYFPLTGIGSFVIDLDDGPSVEVGTIGNECMTGVSLLSGIDRSSFEAFVQIEGDFMRMPVNALKAELAKNAVFANITR